MNQEVAMFESLEKRSMFAISIPELGFSIPNIPGIDIPIDVGGNKKIADSVIANQKKYAVPSLVAASMKNGVINDIAGTGVRQAGTKTKITTSDQYLIGSATKAMTATLAARLVEKGYIKWTTKIIDVFPQFLGGKIRANYENVTLEQLLAHRGGLPNELSTELTIATAISPTTPMKTRNSYLRSILKMKAVALQGNYSYSSTDYIVASTMMETVMRESYEAMMQRLIFTPLDMTSAGFGWPGSASTLDQPRAHDATGKAYLPNDLTKFPGVYNAAGGVHVNLADWSKFIGIQFGVMPKKFLTAASVEKLRTPYNGPGTKYALGWNVISQSGINLIQHDGTDNRWYASVMVNVKEKSAIFVATNQGGPNGIGAVEQTIKDLSGRVIKISL